MAEYPPRPLSVKDAPSELLEAAAKGDPEAQRQLRELYNHGSESPSQNFSAGENKATTQVKWNIHRLGHIHTGDPGNILQALQLLSQLPKPITFHIHPGSQNLYVKGFSPRAKRIKPGDLTQVRLRIHELWGWMPDKSIFKEIAQVEARKSPLKLPDDLEKEDPWEALILPWLQERERFTTQTLCEYLEIPRKEWTQATYKRIAKIMKAQGWQQIQIGQYNQNGYRRPRLHETAKEPNVK